MFKNTRYGEMLQIKVTESIISVWWGLLHFSVGHTVFWDTEKSMLSASCKLRAILDPQEPESNSVVNVLHTIPITNFYNNAQNSFRDGAYE